MKRAALVLLVVCPVALWLYGCDKAEYPLDSSVQESETALFAPRIRSVYPSVAQTVQAVDANTYAYTFEFSIPLDETHTDWGAGVDIVENGAVPTQLGTCACGAPASALPEPCYENGPVEGSVKQTKRSAVATCVFTVPAGTDLYANPITVERHFTPTSFERYFFPGIQSMACLQGSDC